MMELDTQSVLIGALLIEDKLAPYALPELSIEVSIFEDQTFNSRRGTPHAVQDRKYAAE